MREQRQIAMGGARTDGRVCAVGVLTAAAMCVAALSVAIPIPLDPVGQNGIQAIVLGSSPRNDAAPVVRQDGSSELYRRVAAHAPDARGNHAARRRRGSPEADAYGRAGDDLGLGDRGGASPAKPRGGDAPPLPGRDTRPQDRGRSGPGSGSQAGGQDGALVPPSAGAPPAHDQQGAPEPAPPPDIDDAPDVAPAAAASAPDDELSDDPAPAGLAAPAPETDLDAVGADNQDP
jgi:hypothetical protein